VPELIREGQKLRSDLDTNVALLHSTFEQLTASAAEFGWRADPPVRTGTQDTHLLEGLTKREIEVLRLIAEGKSSRAVAAELGMAFRTAVCHRYRIFQKLQIHETASLVRLAVRAGLVKA
jgi:DNA-binding NarL/FixJ family response regulator